ncbi:SDR family oxidoreductase [Bacillus songklensis]|uniref:SDR family oxidoreductase n=1 Tax=Bacillus songklensis TaxID=1069116 RepID=A0ABV8BA05_9BACI
MKDNKVAFITGSATGLGKRTAIELAKKGLNIILNYRSSGEKARELASLLEEEYKIRTLVLQGDISEYSDCESMVFRGMEYFGHIDILINNAGPYVFERKRMMDYDVEQWNYMINGNLNSAFYLCKFIIPAMRQKEWGRIINIGFDRAQTAPAWKYRSAFAAAKTGLVSLTKTLALEEADYGITVNMVCPGDIRGEWKEADIADVRQRAEGQASLPRIGTGEDIARTIAFLCEENSDFITGSIIEVTGGKDVLSKVKE